MKHLIITTLILFSIFTVNAQILRSIARSAGNQVINSAEDRASDEVNKQVDKGVNKFFDDLMKKDSTEKKAEPQQTTSTPTDQDGSSQAASSMGAFMKSLGMSGEVPAHKDVYKFSSQIVMEIQSTDTYGNKAEPIQYHTSFDEKSNDVMLKMNSAGNSSATIIDQGNSCMLILSEKDGSKTGIATKFDVSAANSAASGTDDTPESNQVEEDDCKMAKTGKTKNISGFNCSEYRCETPDAISVAWITKDHSAKVNKIFGGTQGAKYNTDGFEGMVIQYENYSKADKSSMITTIKSVDMKKSSSFSTSGYTITGLSLNMGQ
jgi:hypothetical protein